MPAATFDTLKFANTLKAAGVPSQQAEAQAVAFAEVLQVNMKDLTTKDDLTATAKATKDDLAAMAKASKDDLAATAKAMKDDLAATAKDIRQEIKDARQEIKDSEQSVNSKIDNSIATVNVQIAQVKGELVLMRWMLGVLVGGMIALLIRLFLFRGPM